MSDAPRALLDRVRRAANNGDRSELRIQIGELAKFRGWRAEIAGLATLVQGDAAQLLRGAITPSVPEVLGGSYDGVPGGGTGGKPGTTVAAASMAAVARDATSLIYAPASASDWTNTRGVAGSGGANPISTWLCQESAGNLADSIASNTLVKANNPIYAQALSGWTRVAVMFFNGNDAFRLVAGALGDIDVSSHMLLLYAAANQAPTTPAQFITLGTPPTNSRVASLNATPRYTLTGDDSQAAGTGASNPGTSVRPLILQVDRTNSKMRVITNQEVIEPVYTAPSAAAAFLALGFNGVGADGALLTYIAYAACFRGAGAELTTAQTKLLLQTLGWSVSW